MAQSATRLPANTTLPFMSARAPSLRITRRPTRVDSRHVCRNDMSERNTGSVITRVLSSSDGLSTKPCDDDAGQEFYVACEMRAVVCCACVVCVCACVRACVCLSSSDGLSAKPCEKRRRCVCVRARASFVWCGISSALGLLRRVRASAQLPQQHSRSRADAVASVGKTTTATAVAAATTTATAKTCMHART